MLWLIGVLAAVLGALLVFIATWKSYTGENRNWAIIFGTLGAPGAMYTLLTTEILYMQNPSLLAHVIVPLGFTAAVVNLGRAFASKVLMQKISRNSKLRAICIVESTMFEPFIIYAYMVAILVMQLPNNGTHIPEDAIDRSMWMVSLAGMAGGLLLGTLTKRYEEDKSVETQKDMRAFIIKTMPAHIIGAMGVILAIFVLMPYIQ
jgi:hypothetical protein